MMGLRFRRIYGGVCWETASWGIALCWRDMLIGAHYHAWSCGGGIVEAGVGPLSIWVEW